jgi:hypothetical protein
MLAKGFVFISVGLLCLAPLNAESQVFHDDFDGEVLQPTVWSVEPGDGEVLVANGVVTMTCTGSTFPVVTTVDDPFPPGDFLVSVRLRYTSTLFAGWLRGDGQLLGKLQHRDRLPPLPALAGRRLVRKRPTRPPLIGGPDTSTTSISGPTSMGDTRSSLTASRCHQGTALRVQRVSSLGIRTR